MITTYQANIENDIMFGNSKTPIGKYYIGLSSTPITVGGTGITEPNDVNYRRVELTNDKNTFTTSSDGIVKNNIEIAFPISSKVWTAITHWFIADSISGGNILYYDMLPKTMNVDIHQILKFKPNMIQIKRSGIA